MARIICNGVEFNSIEAILFDKDGTLSNSHQYLQHLGKKRAECIDAIVSGLRPQPNPPLGKGREPDFCTEQDSCFPPYQGGTEGGQKSIAMESQFEIKSQILTAFGLQNPSGLLAVGTREENEIAIAALIAQSGYDWIEARAIAQSGFQLADQQLPRKATLTPLFLGVVELLRSLSSIKLGILSSDSTANVQDFVDYYELSHHFHSLIGAQSGISKPNPKLLTLACQSLEVEPEKTLMIGDTIADVRLSHLSIGVTWGGTRIEQIQGAAAIAHYPDQIQLRHT